MKFENLWKTVKHLEVFQMYMEFSFHLNTTKIHIRMRINNVYNLSQHIFVYETTLYKKKTDTDK